MHFTPHPSKDAFRADLHNPLTLSEVSALDKTDYLLSLHMCEVTEREPLTALGRLT